jgi:hypothetical protein
MKKRIRCLIIVLFVLISLQAQAYAFKMELGAPQEIDEGNLEGAGLVEVSKNTEVITRPNVEYRAQGLRNPFEQPVLVSESDNVESSLKFEVAKLPQLTVQGIIWGGNFPQAIINNKVVKIGDVLEGAEVVEIEKEGVTVLFAGVDYKLTTLSFGNLENK